MFKNFFSKFRAPNNAERPLNFYFDEKVGSYGVGDLPDNLKTEVSALINAKTPGKKFNAAYVQSLNLSEEASQLFSLTLRGFLTCAEHLVGSKATKASSAFKGWSFGLYFIPSAEVNARIRLSADEKVNTVFILINAGLILALLHRHCALFSVPGFFESIASKVRQEIPPPASRLHAVHMPKKEDEWLSVLPKSPRQIAIARLCTVMAAVTVLCHELGHFAGGHLNYLRDRHRNAVELEEACSGAVIETLPGSLRRLLELDADLLAGRFASAFWRELDYPWIGPENAQIESFYMEFVLSTLCLYIVFEEYLPTNDYFSPAWRVEHVLNEFRADFLVKADRQIFDIDSRIKRAVESAYLALGWGNGYTYWRLETETTTLLDQDMPALKSLRKDLAPFVPAVWTFKR